MKTSDINIRDPFILTEGGKYYMYGTRGEAAWTTEPGDIFGFDVYVSEDLENWNGPTCVFSPDEDFWGKFNFWAPEVHKYKGAYYMFASFKDDGVCRGTQILRAETPMGPFVPHSDGAATPKDWECLDGTLHVEPDGTPYMVFCHEWLQVKDGEMCAVRLSDDLKTAVGEPVVLFRASQPAWAVKERPTFVTDGPFMYRTQSGRLVMLWSSSAKDGYCEALSYSDNGSIFGNWSHDERLLFSKDGGHGMIFNKLDGTLTFVCHQPNKNPLERPFFVELCEKDDTVFVK